MKKIMEMLQNMKAKKEQKDNRGFSLVELIIVIAIMAILVGIVGTQVIPYIDKSRNAKDIQKLSGLCTDAMTAYSSNAANIDSAKKYTITIGTNVTISAGKGDDKILASFKELNKYEKIADLGLESKEGKKVTSVTIDCQNDQPMITVTTVGGTFDPITSK